MTKWVCDDCPGRVCEYDDGREKYEPYFDPEICPDDYDKDWDGNKHPKHADWKKKEVQP